MITRRRLLLGSALSSLLPLVGCGKDGASSPSPAATGPSTGTAPGTPSAASGGSASPSEPADPLPQGPFNVILFGTDSRDKNSLQGNADAIVVAQLSADRQRLALVSIARDSYVPIKGGKGKINSAFAMGGTPLLQSTIANLLGIPIHACVQSNFTGFIALTRWLGGITVQNRHASKPRVNSTGRVLDFHTGQLELENTDALIYARERKTLPLGDLDRAERHRALVVGILKVLQPLAASKPDAFATMIGKVAKGLKITGFDAGKVAALATPLGMLDLGKVHSLMVPIARFDTVGGASVNIVDETRTKELGQALATGDLAAYVSRRGEGYAPGQ
ncbi:LCP family protein [Luteococcus sp. Sow4_B9]|uniref:LCP family protein n=1 Tax=Luteococcus sp. Sow4_B9 TaxID=3438792 RepID=UPI003F9A2832